MCDKVSEIIDMAAALDIKDLKHLEEEIRKIRENKETRCLKDRIVDGVEKNGYYCIVGFDEYISGLSSILLPFYGKMCTYDKDNFCDAKVVGAWDEQEEWTKLLAFYYFPTNDNKFNHPDYEDWCVENAEKPAKARITIYVRVYYAEVNELKLDCEYILLDGEDDSKIKRLRVEDDKVLIDDEVYCDIHEWHHLNASMLLLS